MVAKRLRLAKPLPGTGKRYAGTTAARGVMHRTTRDFDLFAHYIFLSVLSRWCFRVDLLEISGNMIT